MLPVLMIFLTLGAASAEPVGALATPTEPIAAASAVAVVGYVDPADVSAVPRHARKTLVLATAKAQRGEHAAAAEVLAAHLRDAADEDHYLLRYHLARCYDAVGRTEAAREEYTQAVALEPRLATAWFGLGHACYTLGDYAGAGDAFLRSFRGDADPQPETLYFAAAGYLLADQPAAAAPLLQELCSGRWGTPRHDWYAQLASCAISLEQADLAASVLAQYLSESPGSHEAWFLAYQFHVGCKDYRKAAIALTVVSYLRDLTPRESRTLGDLYALVDVPALAGRQYRATLSEEANVEDFERLASALVAAHELDDALASLRDGLRAQPTARLWSLLGDVYYLKREFAAAADAYAKVAELDPNSGRALLMIGYCHMERGNRGLAIQHLVAAAKFEDQADLAERLLQRARRMSQT
jgi:tetratricopeptide (TPR) repeat protein